MISPEAMTRAIHGAIARGRSIEFLEDEHDGHEYAVLEQQHRGQTVGHAARFAATDDDETVAERVHRMHAALDIRIDEREQAARDAWAADQLAQGKAPWQKCMR